MTFMKVEEVLEKLKALGNEKVRAQNRKRGAGDNQFGVLHGDIRKLAKTIKVDHDLGLALWATKNIDAQSLAALILKPKVLSVKELEGLVRSVTYSWVADWLSSYVVYHHPQKESLRERWMNEKNVWLAREGWSLTADRVAENPDGLDLSALLTRIENEMPTAAPEAQWTMNICLAKIGIHFSEHRKRAVAIGEKLGLYRDYPVSKGCTSPFAPIWINEMVCRKG